MNEIQKGNAELPKIKIWNGQRVVTFKDIDEVHQRVSGTASRNFRKNKKFFIDGVDYIRRNSSEAKQEYNITAPNGLTLLTESGYLMITKSFTDDLSWDVQRKLVNSYFQVQEETPEPQQKLHRKETYLLKNSPTWFQRNNEKMKMICKYFYWDRKHLYHKILREISDIYSLSNIEDLYISDYGHSPYYKMELVEYFQPLQELADSYIDHLAGLIKDEQW